MSKPQSVRHILKGVVTIIFLFGILFGFWAASWNSGRWGFMEWNLVAFMPLVFCTFLSSTFVPNGSEKCFLQWFSGVLALLSGGYIYWMFHG
jgi:hypothetical protein